MKLSVFYDHILEAAAQTGRQLPLLLREVRDAGIDAVEINMTYLREHQEILDLLKDAGLQVSCVYEFYEMEHKEERDRAKVHVETALRAGAEKILVVPGFLSEAEADELKNLVMDYDKTAAFLEKNEKAKRMAEGLSMATAFGAEAGVTVTIEDFDHVSSPISGLNGMLWYLRQIPQLKATFDTGNFIIHGEAVTEAWEQLQEYVVHVHCKDRGAQAVAVGDGSIPIKAVVDQLRKRGYEGYLAIEHFGAADQEACIRKSAEYLKKLYER